jgi:hypothetical protein
MLVAACVTHIANEVTLVFLFVHAQLRTLIGSPLSLKESSQGELISSLIVRWNEAKDALTNSFFQNSFSSP